MEVKLDDHIMVDVTLGSHVYDEQTDTWISWDMLAPQTQTHLETLVREIETTTTAIRSAVINHVAILMKPDLLS